MSQSSQLPTPNPHPPASSPRLLVIGLDCAAPELIFDAWRAELPTLSRRALEAEGFAVIERRQPSLLVDGCVLITG